MDLERTPEQRQIAETVRRFCQERIDIGRLRAWDEAPDGIDGETWQQVVALGWLGLGVPAASGGSGFGFEEMATWFEEAARGLVPPFVSQAVRAICALASLDPQAPELASLVRGRTVLALSLPPCGEARGWELHLRAQDGHLRMSGRASFTSNGAKADRHLVLAWHEDTPTFALVRAEHARRQPLRTFDGDRQAHLDYYEAPVERVLCRGSDAESLWQRTWAEQRALALAELVGVMDAALQRTVDYVKEREQFGQKIGAFQAVQHQVADMGTWLTAGRHLAWQAISRLARGTLQGFELDAAAAFLGPAARRLTLAAHHLHGGAGYILDHPLHYYTERALTLALRYAPEEPALARMAAWWLDGEFPPL